LNNRCKIKKKTQI